MNTSPGKRVLVLGTGAQGFVVAWVLSQSDDVAVALADLDRQRADGAAASLRPGVATLSADARDVEGTTSLLRAGRYDLVVNTAVPDFIPQVQRAALEARIDYLDLTSLRLHEREGAPIEQLEHAEAWRASGRTAFVNGGSAPGLTNVMAREAADALDEVDAISIRDYSMYRCDHFVTLWAPRVFLVDCATPPLVWRDGTPTRVPIFSGEEEFDFPPPVGRRGKLYLHAHEEPATLPLFIGKPVRSCEYRIGEPEIDAWRFIVERLGLMDEAPVDVGGVRVSPRDLLLCRMPPTLTPARLQALVEGGGIEGCTMVLSEVTGRKAGRRVRITSWSESPDIRAACARIPGASDISLLTSVPAATFALMLLRGQIPGPGVVLPEMLGLRERAILYEGIGRYGIHIRSRVDTIG